MRFSVLAIASVPDTATTRDLFSLHDLDDKSVSKVLFHRRKQQTGSNEDLRWDQRAIAGMTLIQHSVDNVHLTSMHAGQNSEEDMLQAFYKATLRDGRVVSWDGSRLTIPLIHFRTLKHTLSFPAYWQALREGTDIHLDIQRWLSPTTTDLPVLDETSRKLGFPGLLSHDEDSVIAGWMKGNYDNVQAHSDIVALNTYLLALRLFTVTGDMSRHDSARVIVKLRDALAKSEQTHMAEFLAAWGEA